MSAEMVMSTVAVTLVGASIVAGTAKLLKQGEEIAALKAQVGDLAAIRKELKQISEKLNQLIGRTNARSKE